MPAKHHLNPTKFCWLLFCYYVHIGLFQLALRAIWNNLSKEQFSNNAQRRHAWDLKTKEAILQLSQQGCDLLFVIRIAFVFHATP